jgi:polysaccharide pyruvyl transferase WcaK-like protein
MEERITRVGLLHHTGCGNLGDEAVIHTLMTNIRRRWNDAEITVVTMNPEDTSKRHNIPALPMRRYNWSSRAGAVSAPASDRNKIKTWVRSTRNPVVRLLRATFGEVAFLAASYRRVKQFDFLIISGGGQLTERGGPWSFPYALFVWSSLAKWAGVKLKFLNVGAGPLNHRLSQFLVRKALEKAEYVSFRDQQSKELIAGLGFNKGVVCADTVYCLDVAKRDSERRTSPPVVGISPMPYPFSDHLKSPANAIEIQNNLNSKLVSFTSYLVDHSYSVQMFGNDIKVDPLVIEDLRKLLVDRYQISTPQYVPLDSIDELFSRISAMDYVVTCRLHGVVFAHLMNKPILAIAHHPKVTHLMGSIGLSEYCFDMDTFEPGQLSQAFQSLVANREAIKKNMAAKLEEYRERLSIQFDGLFDVQLRAR